MTRLLVAPGALSAATVAFDPAGFRWAGVLTLALIVLAVATKLLSAIRRRAARRTLDGLRVLHPADFEAEVARWLRRDGWQVENRGGTGDGGIDLLARKRKEMLAVQCKRYAETSAVSAAQVRDLYGAAVACGATSALLVTTGRVSAPAAAWAEALPEGVTVAFHDLHCLSQVASGAART